MRRLAPYAVALLSVAAATLISLGAEPHALLEDQAMIYLLAVVLVALRLEVKASLVAAALSILTFDFFIIPPRKAFAWSDARETLTFIAMIVVPGVVSWLANRLRAEEKLARRTAWATDALYQLNVELSGAGHPKQLAAATARHLERLFEGRAVVVLRSPEGPLEALPEGLSPAERARAESAWARAEFTASRRGSGLTLWAPVSGIQAPLGVIGLEAHDRFTEVSQEGRLVVACARELATALERMQLASAVQRSQLEAETERMRSSLLSAISHDLKTPLSAIVAAGTTLLAHREGLEAATAERLLSTIVGEGERLDRLVRNLLSITRLESPTIELARTPESVEEIVAATLDRMRMTLGPRKVNVSLQSDLPWVLAEPALVDQVLVNLLENALRYAPADAAIEIGAQADDGVVNVQVSDSGHGIPPHERDKVFEKFYRGAHASRSDGGVGLGLTICRAIVKAHGGRIAIRGRQGGGTLVEFTLPVARAVPLVHAEAELAS